MYLIMGVHHPKPGMEKSLLDVQEKFGRAQRGHRGLISGFVWKDDASDVIIGITLWTPRRTTMQRAPLWTRLLRAQTLDL